MAEFKQSNSEKLIRRARSKYYTKNVSILLQNANKESQLFKGYVNTYFCNHILTCEDAIIKASYCKNRWCKICNRIKTKNLMKGYKRQIEKMSDGYVVTLTLKTVSENNLVERINEMRIELFKILDNSRKHLGIKISGIRKLEVTIRPANKYHPHYHLIVNGKKNAEYIRDQWLKRWKKKLGDRAVINKAQLIEPARKEAVNELFKYFTKEIGNEKNGDREIINPRRLDVIYRSIIGTRIFQAFGNIKKDLSEIKDKIDPLKKPDDIEGDLFTHKGSDWYSEHGEELTGYKPSGKFKKLLGK